MDEANSTPAKMPTYVGRNFNISTIGMIHIVIETPDEDGYPVILQLGPHEAREFAADLIARADAIIAANPNQASPDGATSTTRSEQA